MTSQRFAVVRGRFAPLTLSAFAVLEDALGRVDRLLILVSAAEQSASCRMPWSAAARMDMVRAATAAFGDRVVIRAVADWRYDPNAREVEEAEVIASAADGTIIRLPDLPDDPEVIAMLFDRGASGLQGLVPDAVMAALLSFSTTAAYRDLRVEYRFVKDYREAWSAAPYPPVLVTVDTIIVHVPDGGCPHLLLIRRGGIPGKGTWALPGGFVDPAEWLIDAAFRELREETGLVLSDRAASLALKGRHVFDAPDRSSRGRMVTHCYYFRVEGGPLPDVVGDDDASEAKWWPLKDLSVLTGQFFEDHSDMIAHFLKDGAF